MEICEAAESGKITGTGLATKKCYVWNVFDETDQAAACAAALLSTPAPPVIVGGVTMTIRARESCCPVGNNGDCWKVTVCLTTEENSGICNPEDFRFSFDGTTREDILYFSKATTCCGPNGIVNHPNGTIIYGYDPQTGRKVVTGCPRKLAVFSKCLNLCYEPGFINGNWFDAVKAALQGTTNSEPITIPIAGGDDMICQPGTALLTSVTGEASFDTPFRVRFCWAIGCPEEINVFIGRPASEVMCGPPSPGNSAGTPYCQLTYPAAQWKTVTKPAWTAAKPLRDTFIPCAGFEFQGGGTGPSCGETGEKFSGPETEFVTEFCMHEIFDRVDHTALFPPGF